MQRKPKQVRQSINKAWLKVKPNRSAIDGFKGNLIQLIDRINENESEEHHKKLVSDFLEDTYYRGNHYINTKGRNDQVIHNGKEPESTVGVIIEAKKPTNKSEMLSKDNINTKAFQELVLYYLRERITQKNLELKYLIATNIYEWFVFDAAVFEKAFAKNKKLVKKFEDFEAGRLSGTTTDFFYSNIAQPFVDEVKDSLEYTWLDILTYNKPLRNNDKKDDAKLIALYKMFSPEHLLKLPFANDSNKLNEHFYQELLHLIGLEEVKNGSKKVIQRPKAGDRNKGSLLENTITQIDSLDLLSQVPNLKQYGATREERLFALALELCITWVNRILFLKLLEAQLISYHNGDADYAFLNLKRIKDYDVLNKLFFQVLARSYEDRTDEIIQLYDKVPYLNSSLFEPTELEKKTLFINGLEDEILLPIVSKTVLKGDQGKKRSGELNALEYLFAFLDAYDFSSEGGEDIQEDNKTLINASVLGLIFEKINGYKDGSFFTPGFITMYMCRETIRRAVVQKFNEVKGWTCESLDELYDKIEDRSEANGIINSLKICDPAVGSGHFLVSALNEILSIKHDLRVLQDRDGRRLKEYELVVENDELIVTDEEGALFEYHPESKESQRVQETLFHEKQTIIENCLFGVDINPNSVKICRLRLWIELLKHAYYKSGSTEEVIPQRMPGSGANTDLKTPDQVRGDDVNKNGKGRHLETLPNIDINIKTGNSLISRFALDADLKEALKKSKWSIDSYRAAVQSYRNARNKDEKREMIRLIDDIKGDFRTEILRTDKNVVKLKKLSDELVVHTTQTSMFDQTAKEKKEWKKTTEKLTKAIAKLETEIEEIKNNKIFENAFEWRFEFPEVLNEQGDFVGFDMVIGNPPYLSGTNLPEQKQFLNQNFKTAEYQLDLYVFFIEKGTEILKREGLLSLITPNSWLKNLKMSKCRKFFLDNISLHSINPNISNAFEEAGVDTLIFISSKGISDTTLDVWHFIESEVFIKHSIKPTRFKNNTDLVFNVEVSDTQQQLLNKISEQSIELEELTEITRGVNPYDKYTGQTQDIIKSKAYHSDHKKDDSFVPEIRGKHVQWFNTNWDGLHYISYGDWLAAARDPKFFTGKRIVMREIISDRLICDVIEDDFIIDRSLYIARPIYADLNCEYLLGILGSRLMIWFFRYERNEFDDLFPKIRVKEFRNLPIRQSESQLSIANKVADVRNIKKENPQADTSALEAEIDQMVYELYGLSKEEIAIVEGSVGD